ncbi:MAG: glycosyltransferase family 39 protein [Candidatus Fermentibacteraceae bacterium]|nr:glycosyltransferase family 39 protein [Candidatus Fermentibacteraceae bacterium]
MFRITAERTRKNESRILLVLFLFALALRLVVVLHNPIPAGDGIASNLEIAENLRDGNGFSTMRKWTLFDQSLDPIRPEGNRQPIMSLLILLLFTITGPGFLSAQLLSLLIGLACLAVCWYWARKNFGVIPALLSTLVLAIHPLFIYYSTQPDSLLLFTALFFLILLAADREKISFRQVILLGVLSALAYLVRTQGMLLAFSMGIWVLIRGDCRKFLKALLFLLVFLITCMPWFVRNSEKFGSITYSQNRLFLLNENHWAAWEVRESASGPTDMIRYQGPAAVMMYTAKGFLRIFEPITTGTLHRGEIFAQPPLIGFAILALLALKNRNLRRKMLLPMIAALPIMAVLVLHVHSGRYLSFLNVIVIALGCAGLGRLLQITGKRTAAVAGILLIVPFALPLGSLLIADSSEKASEAEEVAEWIIENSSEDDWVVTYPTVEMLIWTYSRPTLTMPNDYEMLLWPCLEEHGVRYIVIDRDISYLRPRLSSRWRRTPDGLEWEIIDPPDFLEEVYRTRSGFTIVYEMTGEVPDGFMYVDNLPRDNMRALPPGGAN